MQKPEFFFIDPKLIVINRADRQRRDLGDLTDMMASIGKVGVINPILVKGLRSAPELVAGERRLQSCLNLELTEVPIGYKADLTINEAAVIELEENIKRADLSWRDFTIAVGRLHDKFLADEPEWKVSQTAKEISYDERYIYHALYVYRQIDSDKIVNAGGLQNAYAILTRFEERQAEGIVQDIIAKGSALFGDQGTTQAPVPTTSQPAQGLPPSTDPLQPLDIDSAMVDFDQTLRENFDPHKIPLESLRPIPAPGPRFIMPSQPVINASFLNWVPDYDGPKFNLIHCDFPYGTYKGDDSKGTYVVDQFYDNTPDVYWALTECLVANLDKIMSHSAHMVFWFDMKFYYQTMTKLASAGLMVHPHPLMWHKTNGGVIPGNPSTHPRRTYDTAFLAVRGGRPLANPGMLSYAAPMVHNKFHPSQKPEPMLRFFMKMFVDETTSIFDPTVGSGSALRAAEDLGAKLSLGIELDPAHAEAANKHILSARVLRKVGK